MNDKNLNFKELKKQLNMSSLTLNKILKWNQNVTFEIIAEKSASTGLKISIQVE